MKYKRIVLALVVLGALLASLSAQAITFGQPDGSRHANVGVMAFFDQENGELNLVCSGTLISPTVFLTAAHCTSVLAENNVAPDDAWVTFDPTADTNATFYRGTYELNPDFGHDMGDPHDVAVVVLDEPISGIAPAALPTAGLLDQMNDAGTLKSTPFVAVGYGLVRDDKTGGPHNLRDNDERRYVEQSFQALKPALIQFSTNPATDNGGTCYGDSGGPHFIDNTDVVVAVTTGGDAMCRATDVDYRLETEAARSYLAQFVALP
jgi:hypothetical protein